MYRGKGLAPVSTVPVFLFFYFFKQVSCSAGYAFFSTKFNLNPGMGPSLSPGGGVTCIHLKSVDSGLVNQVIVLYFAYCMQNKVPLHSKFLEI